MFSPECRRSKNLRELTSRLGSDQFNAVAGIEKYQSAPQSFDSPRHRCKFRFQFRYGHGVSVSLDKVIAYVLQSTATTERGSCVTEFTRELPLWSSAAAGLPATHH